MSAREGECQFVDTAVKSHRPFSERAPICWDCHHGIIEDMLVEAAELRSALSRMIDWHERGDMDSTVAIAEWFRMDLDNARALLAPRYLTGEKQAK